MKVAILFVGGLLVGTAAGTVARAMTMELPPSEEVVEGEYGEAADGTPAEGSTGFVDHEAPTGSMSADTEVAPVEDTGTSESRAAEGEPVSSTHDGTTTDATPPPTPSLGTQGLPMQGSAPAGDLEPASVRMSQIFGAMDAKAAASVLVELSDGEIREILQHLSARKTSAIIKAMPPERAAALSRVMMGDGGGE